MAPPALNLPKPAAMLKASASSGVAAAAAGKLLEFPDPHKPRPTAPAAHIVHFDKATEAVYVRLPADLYAWVQSEADAVFMTKPHWIKRVLQERKDRNAISESVDIKDREVA